MDSETLQKIGLAAGGAVALASALSHVFPPYTIAGKICSWIALNFGRAFEGQAK